MNLVGPLVKLAKVEVRASLCAERKADGRRGVSASGRDYSRSTHSIVCVLLDLQIREARLLSPFVSLGDRSVVPVCGTDPGLAMC